MVEFRKFQFKTLFSNFIHKNKYYMIQIMHKHTVDNFKYHIHLLNEIDI